LSRKTAGSRPPSLSARRIMNFATAFRFTSSLGSIPRNPTVPFESCAHCRYGFRGEVNPRCQCGVPDWLLPCFSVRMRPADGGNMRGVKLCSRQTETRPTRSRSRGKIGRTTPRRTPRTRLASQFGGLIVQYREPVQRLASAGRKGCRLAEGQSAGEADAGTQSARHDGLHEYREPPRRLMNANFAGTRRFVSTNQGTRARARDAATLRSWIRSCGWSGLYIHREARAGGRRAPSHEEQHGLAKERCHASIMGP
jgi:hypothetical protein